MESGVERREEESGVGGCRVRTMRKRRGLGCVFRCFRLDHDLPSVDVRNESGGVDMVSATPDGGVHPNDGDDLYLPTHLIVAVNGIIGRPDNWKYAAKKFLNAYPQDVIVHCSERNRASLTFDGVDVMGERLADEVTSVIEQYPHLRKISFISHSLGGLVARYAITLLYGKNYLTRLSKVNGQTVIDGALKPLNEEKYSGKIAGLDPFNFITCATPHLGSRGHKQVPLFCGLHTLEIAAQKASWLLGRTGRHLFLTDDDDGKLPLLFRMVKDWEDLPFMSALKSFRRRVAYANVSFDQLVGWCTSSLRHENELPKHLLRNDQYRHIVNIEAAEVPLPPQTVQNSESILNSSQKMKTEEMMEVMIRELSTLSWERIDVKFRGGRQRLLAHGTIQVETYCLHSSGADVIQHMIDNFQL